MAIQFGTDGWRAIIGEDFIPENVEKVIQAFCDWQCELVPTQQKIFLGFDRRMQSQETSQLVAQVLAGNGFQVQLSSQFCPTPCISWMVKQSDAMAGIMVTASHNPWQWNGIKFKESYGGSASPEYTGEIERRIKDRMPIQKMDLGTARKKGLLQEFDPQGAYVNQLKSLLDLETISKSGMKILYDPMYGAGSGFVHAVLGETSEIHASADSKFGGINPEPIGKNLGELLEKMKTGKWQIGLATDGDADRIGAVDEKGTFVNSHQIFALLLKHYVEDKGLTGRIVKSISTTNMINLLCKKYGLELIETPIGFRHICKKLMETEALMGGEESGGISFKHHVHERDGILNGLMLVEMMAQRGRPLGELVDELYEDIGPHYFGRQDFHVDSKKIEMMKVRLQSGKIPGLDIRSVSTIDGSKFLLNDGWLLIRTSGTEPLVRVYAEAADQKTVDKLLEVGSEVVNGHSRESGNP